MEGSLALRLFLPTYIVAYILLLGPLRIRAFRRRYGFDPTDVGEADPVLARQESLRDALFLVLLALTFTNAAWPSVQEYLGPVRYLERGVIQVLAVTLLVASLGFVGIAQAQLGRSWRYGIDRSNPPADLVRTGLFSLSRNPIYLGMLLTMLGVFLALPNAITFALVAVTYVMLSLRITAEEEFLSTLFGAEFDAYRQRVPRWLVGPGG